MFKRYLCEVYFGDDLIYKKAFKSINNALKVLSGFDEDIYMEITDLVFDRIIPNFEVKSYIKELCSDCED